MGWTRRGPTLLGLALAGGLLVVLAPAPASLPVSFAGAAAWADRSPDAAVATLVALAAGLCWLWLAVGVLLALLGSVPGAVGRHARSLLRVVTPHAVRRLLELSLGLSLAGGTVPAWAGVTGAAGAGGPAAPASRVAAALLTTTDAAVRAHAAASASHPAVPVAGGEAPGASAASARGAGRARPAAAREVPVATRPSSQESTPSSDGTPAVTAPSRSVPDLTTRAEPWPDLDPTAGEQPRPDPGRTTTAEPWPDLDPTAGAGAVVVQPGDSLWAIAESRLGADATAARTELAWRRWYAANRSVIGLDPDLIRPGQLLVPPHDGAGPTPPGASRDPA